MFLTFTKRKVFTILLLLFLLVFASLVTIYVENRWKIRDAVSLHSRSWKENAEYWWSNKLFGGNAALVVQSKNDGTVARSIPVLVYHGLADEGGGENPFSPAIFSEHMNALKSAGWSTITLDEYERFIRGEIMLPERSFLLTFDDGRKDTFYPSDPVLKDLDMHAVMFAITKKSLTPTSEQSPYYMSLYELEAMERSGRWDVESHGRDSHDWYYVNDGVDIGHFFSNRLWVEEENRIETIDEYRERIKYDLSNSKADLENALDKTVRAFAFPFSDFGQDTVNFKDSMKIIKEEVPGYYSMAFYQVWPGSGETFNYPSEDETMMKRIEPYGDWSREKLLETLETGLSKNLPFKAVSFGEEWISGWGSVTRGEELIVSAQKNTTGASANLNGSWWWDDYTFNTNVNWKSGSNIVLAAMRADDDNYFGCNFGRNGKVYIKSVIDGESHNLIDANYVLGNLNNVSLGISVSGSNISCLVNGEVVIGSLSINRRITNGGIGIEIWDERDGVAEAVFDNINVSSI